MICDRPVNDMPIYQMAQLDNQLTHVMGIARKQPVLIQRYNKPFVCIFPYEQAPPQMLLGDYVSERHPLRPVKDYLDHEMARQAAALNMLRRRHLWPVPPKPLVRAVILWALYSLEDEASLHDQICCNLAFRWFVEADLLGPIWPQEQFVRGLRKLFTHRSSAMTFAYRATRTIQQQFAGKATEFRLNVPFVESWVRREIARREPGS
ncbi:Uncharacterised protein [Bordetella ansorpii]|uniref:Transposase InsH N-terminal domain-containing protein n=2 Tax=Bordetella ansorpii TaxID=288768 RepID=A0A157QNG0_9BORD|nr:Uncharacterised protein [Bordetella ansorpii]